MSKTLIIRVTNPLQNGRIALRVDDDWNRDVEAVSVEAGQTTFEFHYNMAQPYFSILFRQDAELFLMVE